jgi:hypothetical protein
MKNGSLVTLSEELVCAFLGRLLPKQIARFDLFATAQALSN